MEKLKEPSMLLSVANSIGLVGTTAYFYKQYESLKLEQTKMQQTIQGIIRKMSDMEKGDQNKGEALHTLNDQVKRINGQLDEIPTFNNIDDLDMDLSEIIAVLNENDIPIERPSQGRMRSGDRRDKPPRRDNYNDRYDSRRIESRPADRYRPSSFRDTDSKPRGSHTSVRNQPKTEPQPSYDDDEDLIENVRRQTRN